MIEIRNIKYGWLDLYIDQYCFTASYLTDVVDDLNYLFNVKTGESKLITVNGEDKGDLNLISFISWGKYKDTYDWLINIVWNPELEDDLEVIQYPFNDFIKEWNQVKEDIEEDYKLNFLPHYDDEEDYEIA